ncbi:hypothetical protein MYX04_11220 [Nitrospiraceae bacterium AH_259_D15_M11_P09]|nr:hypothetical protein [Nitrospiraceae bacterium AH_259_D15_M11_P09]
MNGKQLVPLSADLELRPRDATPASVRRMLGPVLQECVNHIADSITRLRQLADQACLKGDRSAEALLRTKLIELATNLLRLCRDEREAGSRELRSQNDLPNWDALPLEAQNKYEEFVQYMEKAWGPDWDARWRALP